MSKSVAFRTDVAAVGPIRENDMFIMALVMSPDYYSNKHQDNIDGSTYGIATVFTQNASGNFRGIFFSEAVWGSMLSRQVMPLPDMKIVYWKFRPFNILPLSYQDYVSRYQFLPYEDPEGTIPFGGGAPTLGWDPNLNGDLNLYQNVNGVTLKSTFPLEVPQFNALQTGVRYVFNDRLEGSGGKETRFIRFIRSCGTVGSSRPNYEGLPDNNTATDCDKKYSFQDIIIYIKIEIANIVFLPVSWLTGACTSSLTIDASFSNAENHICDRWCALNRKGTDQPFCSFCSPIITLSRGVTTDYTCAQTSGKLYYPSNLGGVCGSQWNTGVSMPDMTDTMVTAQTSVGPCGQGICYFDGDNFSCLQVNTSDLDTCQVDCSQCESTQCSGCGDDRCNGFKPTPDQCKASCPANMSCTNVKGLTTTPSWVWIVLVVLAVAIVILVFMVLSIPPIPNDNEFDTLGKNG